MNNRGTTVQNDVGRKRDLHQTHPVAMWTLTDRAALFAFALGAFAAICILFAVLAVAFFEMMATSFKLTTAVFHHQSSENGQSDEIQVLLHGIELLFLAPLPYVVMLTQAQYIRTYRNAETTSGISWKLTHSKALMVSLLIAMISTDLVGKLLHGDPPTLQSTGVYLLTLVTLTVYYWVLSSHADVSTHSNKS